MKIPTLFLITLIGTLGAAEIWPRFRGENGTGLSSAKIPAALTKENRLWSVPLPGPGSSSPVIWEGKVFLTTEDRDQKTVSLVCLDAKSGEMRWAKVLNVGKYHLHRFNNTAAATAAVDAGTIAVTWFDGTKKVAMLSGYTHDGGELWQHEIGPFKGKHGATIQPAIHSGKVLYVHLHQKGGHVGAVDSKTGKPLWKTDYPGDPVSYVTPLIVNEEVIATSQSTGMISLDLKTGKEKWALPDLMKNRTIVSPINVLAGSGEVLLAAGCKNGTYLAVKPPQGKGEGGGEPEVAWRMKGNTPYVPTPVSDGTAVYALSDGGILTAMKARSGEKLWQEKLMANFYASPLIIDGKLYALTREGEMVVGELGGKWKEVSRTSLEPGPESKWADATPAVAHGRIYVRLGARLDCFGKK